MIEPRPGAQMTACPGRPLGPLGAGFIAFGPTEDAIQESGSKCIPGTGRIDYLGRRSRDR